MKIINNFNKKKLPLKLCFNFSEINLNKFKNDKNNNLQTMLNIPKNLLKLKNNSIASITPNFNYFFKTGNKESIEINELDYLKFPNKKWETELKKTAYSSFYQMIIHFDKDKNLQKDFEFLISGNSRIGKLLEVLDIFSALSIFKMQEVNKEELTLVTVSVSAIKLFNQIKILKPLTINSYVTYVGTSSIENRIDLFNSDSTNENEYVGSAFFHFAARSNKNYSKPMTLEPLKLDFDYSFLENHILAKENMIKRNKNGEENKNKLKEAAKNSLYTTIPNEEEIKELHKIFLNKKNKKVEHSVESTKVEKVEIMFNEHMNYNGHIFGGFIMREALESAYACVRLYSYEAKFEVLGIDSISFYKPVLVNSLASFNSYLSYVIEDLLVVVVEVYNIVDGQKDYNLTTTLSIVFKSNTINKRVIPETYDCGIRYLDAKRRLERLIG